MAPAQAPAVPDASALALLSPPVALALLATVSLLALLFYFGKPMAERLRGGPKEKPADAVATASLPPALPSPVAVLDRATEMTNRLIETLEEQVSERDEEIDRLRGELGEERRAHERTRMDLERCRDQWRRP